MILVRQDIKKILPHRGKMLLLDRVLLDSDKIVGELLVTQDLCEGHVVFEGRPILRGSDVYDMAGQLLGVWASLQPFKVGKGLTLIRKFGEAKFKDKISPGDLLTLELCQQNVETKSVGNSGRLIIGKNFLAKVGNELKSEISFVELFLV